MTDLDLRGPVAGGDDVLSEGDGLVDRLLK
jgi:hypothetical protein